MTWAGAALGVAAGFVSGMLSGLFGVGGGIVMTPAIQLLLGASPIVALATPLPVILPTAATGAYTYRKAGEADLRAAMWMAVPGIAGAVGGAALTDVIQTDLLLVVTALLLAWQAIGILRGIKRRDGAHPAHPPTRAAYATIGLAAGVISGLLGIGGGIIMVPLMVGFLGLPLKLALGTSLVAIIALVVPGTIVHTALGHIDWAIFAVVTVGAVPGARLGSSLALGTRERTLRVLVGSFLLVVALVYGAIEAHRLLGSVT